MRRRLELLFDADYIYSVQVKSTENYILSHLAVGDVSEALMELYTTREPKSLKNMEEDIFNRLRDMGYRLVRLQINQFTSNLVGMMRRETDFKRGERILKKVMRSFFPKLQEFGVEVQTDEALFRLNWCLVDLYLREGDIVHAGEVLSEMKALLSSMNYRAENLRYLYLYLDRKALFEINCMEYEKAVQTIQQAICCMEEVRAVLEQDALIGSFFREERICSEWLGNAYCMKIYAEMFLQRFHPEMYCDIKKDIETALAQYAYSGELERNQQYYAHVEMEAGHYREALGWLFRTQELDLDADITENCVSYLDYALDEDNLSRVYYLMYYVEIMAEAQRAGDLELTDAMQCGLMYQKEIMEELLLEDALETDLCSDKKNDPKIFRDFLWTTLRMEPAEYHPLEIVRWKYGSYLAAAGNAKKACEFWEQAVRICDKNSGSMVLRMVSLAIQMEWLALLLQERDPMSRELRNQMNGCIDQLLKDDLLLPRMREYVTSCRETLKAPGNPDVPAEEKSKLCYQESRKIAF